jgi:hypothetical protein
MTVQLNLDGRTGTVGSGGVVDFSANDRKTVVFYMKAVHDPVASRERGRPWSKPVIYVRIQEPGEKDYVDRPVLEDDIAKALWPRQWAAFEKKQEQVPNGTPVDCLFPESPEIAANLHSVAIHTVEQLAGLTAHGMQTIGMGALQWQTRAKEFLASANGGAGMHKLRAENERQANAIETLTNQIALLKSQLDRVLAERDQKVPPAMIPHDRPTVAQAQAMAMPAYQPTPELSDEPLFIEVEDGVTGPEIEQPTIDPPKRRGRPPRTPI